MGQEPPWSRPREAASAGGGTPGAGVSLTPPRPLSRARLRDAHHAPQAPTLPAPWGWLAPALHAVGCPLLDPRFRFTAGRHCGPNPDGLPPRGQADAAAVASAAPARGAGGGVGAAAGAAVAVLVEKMRRCDEEASGGQLPRRCATEWDDGTRAAVLGLLAEATPT